MPSARRLDDASEKHSFLNTLLEVSQALASSTGAEGRLPAGAGAAGAPPRCGAGAVTLLDAEPGTSRIEASIGLSSRGAARRSYKLGEGITGRVVQTGKPIVVPQVSREPLFLNRAFGGKRGGQPGAVASSACPSSLNRKPVGALGVDLEFEPGPRPGGHGALPQRGGRRCCRQALAVHRLLEEERQKLVEENTSLRQELRERYDFSNIIGTAGPMRQVYEQMAQVARTQTTVLIRGESGTGKELIAHAIHYNSHARRRSRSSRSTARRCRRR